MKFSSIKTGDVYKIRSSAGDPLAVKVTNKAKVNCFRFVYFDVITDGVKSGKIGVLKSETAEINITKY